MVLFKKGDNFIKSSLIVPEIGVVQIQHYDWRIVFCFQIVKIGFLYVSQILGRNVALNVSPSFFDLAEQYFYRSVQVNQEFWLGEGGGQHRKKALEQSEFLIVQVIFCEKQCFDKKIVGNCERLEQVRLGKMFRQLLVAFGHEEQFDGEGIALRLFVERREERVVGELFQDQRTAEVLSQLMAQGGFARANISFYGDKTVAGQCSRCG